MWINDLSCTECAVSVITIISVGLCIHICRTLEQLTAVLDEILDSLGGRIIDFIMQSKFRCTCERTSGYCLHIHAIKCVAYHKW